MMSMVSVCVVGADVWCECFGYMGRGFAGVCVLVVVLWVSVWRACVDATAGGCGFRGSSLTAVNSYYSGGSPNISLSSLVTTAEVIVGKFQFFFMWRKDSYLAALENLPILLVTTAVSMD
ncbi:hypothetical protein U1Q18_017043 [Sarracenia purpurea var. burkii]